MRDHDGVSHFDAAGELRAALMEVSKAYTLLAGLREAMPVQLHPFHDDVTRLLESAVSRLRTLGVHLTETPAAADGTSRSDPPAQPRPVASPPSQTE